MIEEVVVAGVQFDAVEPGALRPPSGRGVGLHDARDVGEAEIRGRPLAAAERELGEGRGAVRVKVVREATEGGKQGIVMDPELIREAPTGPVHVEGADDDQTHPPLRPGGVEAPVLQGRLAACGGEIEDHGGHDEAVPDRELPDLAGAE